MSPKPLSWWSNTLNALAWHNFRTNCAVASAEAEINHIVFWFTPHRSMKPPNNALKRFWERKTDFWLPKRSGTARQRCWDKTKRSGKLSPCGFGSPYRPVDFRPPRRSPVTGKDPDLESERGKALRILLYLAERDQAISYLQIRIRVTTLQTFRSLFRAIFRRNHAAEIIILARHPPTYWGQSLHQPEQNQKILKSGSVSSE